MKIEVPSSPGSTKAVPPEKLEAVVRFLSSRKPSDPEPHRRQCATCGSSIDERAIERDGISWSRMVLHSVSAHGMWWPQIEELSLVLVSSDGGEGHPPREAEEDGDLPFSGSADPTSFGSDWRPAAPQRSLPGPTAPSIPPIPGGKRAGEERRAEVTGSGGGSVQRKIAKVPGRGQRRTPADRIAHGQPDQFGLDYVQAADAIVGTYAVTPQLAAAIVKVAREIGAHPYDLANEINFESAHTFSPSVRGPSGGTATGLIQFTSGTAKGLGTTTAALAAMSGPEQMEWVQLYFDRARRGRPLDDPQKLAMAVFYPAAMSWPSDRQFPPDVIARNTHIVDGRPFPIRTPADYVTLLRRDAKLPSSDSGADSMSTGDGPQDQGLLDQLVSWASGIFWPEQASCEKPGSTATWDLAAGASGALVDGSGKKWGPGQIPPGSYRLVSSGKTSAPFQVEAGRSYRASSIGRVFPI